MRKLKSMLFTAGIAAVLAVGVGASVATTGRDIIKASAATGDVIFNLDRSDLSVITTSCPLTDLTLKSDDGSKSLNLQIKGCRTGSEKDGKINEYDYIMFCEKQGFVYSTNTLTDYYISSVVATYTSSTSKSGQYDISFTNAVNNARASKTATIDKTNGNTVNNKNKTLTYFNFTSGNKNVQVENLKIVYSLVEEAVPTERNFELNETAVNTFEKFPTVIEARPNSLYSDTTAWSFEKTAGDAELTITNEGPKATVVATKAGTATLQVKATDGTDVKTKDVTFTVGANIDVAAAKKLKKGTVGVKGVITDKKSNNCIFIADANGVGMSLIADNLATICNNMNVGDNIIAKGSLSDSYDKIELNAQDIIIDEESNVKVTPIVATLDKLVKSDQGNIVTIKHLNFVSKTSTGKGAYNYLFKDKNNKEITVHIYGDNVAKFDTALKGVEQQPVSLKGIVYCYYGKFQLENSNGLDVNIEKLSEAGLAVVDKIINTLTCDATGVTAPSVDVWNEIKADYDKLSNDDKVIFVSANAANKECGAAVAKYDYIVTKYGKDVYADFMLRDPATGTAVTPMAINNSIMITCIVVISALAITGISVLVIVKRRKATR